MSSAARRYAQAAVEAAEDKGGAKDIEAVAIGLRVFADAFRESADLHELVLNPALKDGRDEVLGALGKKLGMSELAVRVVILLTEAEHIQEVSEVAAEVEHFADERLNRERARVRSAVPLSDKQQKRLKTALEKRLEMPLVLDCEVDPSIIGGLVCQVGSFTIDSSVKRQLAIMTERLMAD